MTSENNILKDEIYIYMLSYNFPDTTYTPRTPSWISNLVPSI